MVARLGLILCLVASHVLADWAGPVEAIDGDTLRMDGQNLRLWGIDAPERRQACKLNGSDWPAGIEATEAVSKMVKGKPLSCRDTGDRTYGRPVVKCSLDGLDLGELIVQAGWAFDYPRYSKGAYTEAQNRAQNATRGVWRGVCRFPWDWRRANR